MTKEDSHGINLVLILRRYDMRRLSEILAFPKAWYRRTLVRRLFLGEFKTTSFHSAETTTAASNVGGPEAAASNLGGVRKATLAVGAANAAGKQGCKLEMFHSSSFYLWVKIHLPHTDYFTKRS